MKDFSRRAGLGAGTAMVATLAIAAPAYATPGFGAPTLFATGAGTTPFSVATGDLDGDGNLDVASADLLGDSVTVKLGDGKGALAPKSTIQTPSGSHPDSLTVADFNEDGKPDLAISLDGSAQVLVRFGAGDGTFTTLPPVSVGVGVNPRWVTVADFNGDRNADLATADTGSDTVSVVLGNGDGTFAARTAVPTGGMPDEIASADFNRDGKADIVSPGEAADGVSVLLGDGAGGFSAPTTFFAGADACSVGVGDLTGDGNLDLVTANCGADNVAVLAGDGQGGFALRTTAATGVGVSAVVLNDFDRDGRLDVATANRSSNSVSVLAGDGMGGLSPRADYPAGPDPFSLATADLSRDGNPDLVMADYYGPGVSVLLGAPTFPPPIAPRATPARDTTAPVITQAKLSPSRFTIDGRAQASARKPKRGTKLSLRLSENATVVFVTEQRKGKRWRKVRIFGQRLRAGRSLITYSGKIKPRGKQRALKPGRYRVRMRPSDRAGNRGRLTTLGFTIVRR